MNDDLVKDLEAVLTKHKQPKPMPSGVTRWMPICEEYKTSDVASVRDTKGGDYIIGRRGREVRVLWWVQVRIDLKATVTSRVTVLSVEAPCKGSNDYCHRK